MNKTMWSDDQFDYFRTSDGYLYCVRRDLEREEAEARFERAMYRIRLMNWAFGWLPVHSPSQPWKVERVAAERRYCLKCFGERTFDVIFGDQHYAAVCRCCGEEVQSGR